MLALNNGPEPIDVSSSSFLRGTRVSCDDGISDLFVLTQRMGRGSGSQECCSHPHSDQALEADQ